MDIAKKLYREDIARYGAVGVKGWTRRFLFYFRKVSCNTSMIGSAYYRLIYRWLCEKHGIEISRKTKIGKGLYIGHPYNITINEKAVLGDNVNIHKGVTIGQENRGKRKGVPVIGNYVWIGVNSTIVGNVKVGDDVLIAPNTYVNCDIPSHSVVLGNPCQIIPKDNATEGYVNNISVEG